MLSQEFPQGVAHFADKVIGLHIGDTPVSAWPLSFLVFLDEVFLKRNKEHDHRPGFGQKIPGEKVFGESNLREDLESLINSACGEDRLLPPPPDFLPVSLSIHQLFDESA
jgi:hypothetical protein